MVMIGCTQDRVFHIKQVRAEFDGILCRSCILQDWCTVSPDYKQFLLFYFFHLIPLAFSNKMITLFQIQIYVQNILKQIYVFFSCHYSCFLDVLYLILQNLPLGWTVFQSICFIVTLLPSHVLFKYRRGAEVFWKSE